MRPDLTITVSGETYKLRATIHHKGTKTFGHYMAQVWNGVDRSWVMHSDQHIVQRTDEFVNNEADGQVCLMMYDWVPSNSSNGRQMQI